MWCIVTASCCYCTCGIMWSPHETAMLPFSLFALEERRPHPPKPKEIEIFAPGLGALPKFLKGPFARGCGDVASPSALDTRRIRRNDLQWIGGHRKRLSGEDVLYGYLDGCGKGTRGNQTGESWIPFSLDKAVLNFCEPRNCKRDRELKRLWLRPDQLWRIGHNWHNGFVLICRMFVDLERGESGSHCAKVPCLHWTLVERPVKRVEFGLWSWRREAVVPRCGFSNSIVADGRAVPSTFAEYLSRLFQLFCWAWVQIRRMQNVSPCSWCDW